MRLIIGNKNYSSWSLRPWILLRTLQIPFEEHLVRFDTAEFMQTVEAHSPTRRVPVLIDGDVTVWDSLAIAEYLNDVAPDAGVWPADRAQRAHARSLCAEVHSGFANLRNAMPMNCSARLPGYGRSVAVERDIERLVAAWEQALAQSNGPFLFGPFCAADAFFAPIASRLTTYEVELSPVAAGYVTSLMNLVAMREWLHAASLETDFVEHDEPYRRKPAP